ncbi:hypothetical protein FQN54_006139 [Arachnomyces sp. PD_36]|nr:hypothetical protein FQN54_006139 [Arachnomyces sp. PD_36]
MAKSALDLIDECDKFPYYHDDPALYTNHLTNYHAFKVSDCDSILGYILNTTVNAFPWPKDCWQIDSAARTVTLLTPHFPADTTSVKKAELRSELISRTLAAAVEKDTFKVLRGWRNELYPVYGPGNEVLLSMERSATPLFGVVTYGVHMTAYTRDSKTGEIKIWVPRRSASKQTYPSMLDNTVGGGMSTGELPGECAVREAMEEASIPEEIVKSKAQMCGAVTYFYMRDARAGGETGLLQPEVEYIYDIELDASVVPQPCDTEVEDFRLWGVEEVKEAMWNSQFKPNAAIVLLDFFIRHGIMTPENEKNYLEIVTRLHRKFEFPIPK